MKGGEQLAGRWVRQASSSMVQEVGHSGSTTRIRRSTVVRRRQAERLIQLPRPGTSKLAAATRLAFNWLGEDGTERKVTYAICRRRRALRQRVERPWRQKGESSGIYLPMIPEVAVAMLACAQIGPRPHNVVFGGFFAGAGSRADGVLRGEGADHRRWRVTQGTIAPIKQRWTS